ncbi:2,5-diketo-D-gluconate reductase A [Loktanella atrilutea]|uniref:2,5-diketo-D-gluconate reductase A n=1 Tax=Loktanella atrilutea TaxID=366533 RepID=A0A1M4SYR4_LOKAT|nr:aldo/keto reductase [Loktanella atrilutea]SHE37167.1 2,5-diketo-D-gluconate reductase A [Loktanella atrilutea]
MSAIPNKTFTDGKSIPAFGLGIWQVPQEETARVVRESIEMGYPLIDGAAAYRNEEQLGEGIRSADKPRDDLFITSKVWNDGMDYDAVRRSVDDSLKRIGLERLDLMLIHWPFPKQDAYVDAWKALIAARADGQVSSIGVCNFHEAHLKRIIDETGEAPVLNQIEVNPMLQQAETVRVNAAHDIVTQSWSPLGNARSFDADPIKAVAERTGKTAPQVILRWHLQRGNAVIARSTKTDHLRANMEIFDFEITQAEMDAIAKLDQNERTGPDPETFNG